MAPTASVRTRPEAPTRHGDIADRADLAALLREFYGRAFHDELLGPVFVDIAQMDLDAHLPTMCDFWETVLFQAGTYKRNALQPHQRVHALANLTPTHFARWLTLWKATVDDRHVGEKAELAKLQASRMAGAMSRRITGALPAEAVTERAKLPGAKAGS
jgi:hemoglobin